MLVESRTARELFREGRWIFYKSGGAVVFGDVFLEGFQVAGEPLDDFGVGFEEVFALGHILVEVVELPGFSFFPVEFPWTGADGLEAVSGAVEKFFVGSFGFTAEGGPDVFAIDDTVVGDFRSGEFCEGGEEVHGGHDLGVVFSGGDFSGPADDGGLAHAAFESRSLIAAEDAGAGVEGSLGWAVVGGEDDEGVFVEAVGFEGVENAADRPIDFGDGLAEEFVAGRVVDVAVFFFELGDGALGDSFHEGR